MITVQSPPKSSIRSPPVEIRCTITIKILYFWSWKMRYSSFSFAMERQGDWGAHIFVISIRKISHAKIGGDKVFFGLNFVIKYVSDRLRKWPRMQLKRTIDNIFGGSIPQISSKITARSHISGICITKIFHVKVWDKRLL